MQVMLLTVKKQVEETMEVKTPSYYKDDLLQRHYFVSDDQIIVASSKMVYAWGPEMGKPYEDEIWHAVNKGTECTKEEFDKAYQSMIEKLDAAIGAVINS